ncbi:Mobile element protein [uncultured Gammaproteobacteria bacterium]|nr:Mobile element protein [uncultured Gammaproteobacteria bacterium]
MIDTTVQEKNITYPTDAKLAIKIINRLNKLAKRHGIQQRRTYVKEVKNCRLSIRHFRHVKKRAKAKKALTRLRTIANKLIRELQRKLPTHSLFETYQKDFLFYQQVLAQQPKDKNKIYSLHEPMSMSLPKAKTTSNMNTVIKSLLSLPKTITLLLAWSVMIKTSTILKP